MADKRGSLLVSFIIVIIAVAINITLYLITEDENAKLLFLITTITVVVIGIGVLVWQFMHGPTKLNRKLKEMEKQLPIETADELKGLYLEIYNLYMKLPKKQKSKFYDQIISIRTTLEQQLHAEKRVETLLEESKKGTITQLKTLYDEIHKQYEYLPEKIKKKYYNSVVALKHQLASGTTAGG